jgi:hypothetical protein
MRLLLVWTFASMLPACTLVEGDRIFARELAAEHSAFAGLDPKIDLGPAPVAGARRTLKYYELDRIAKEHSVQLPSDAAHEACFERATVSLDEESVRGAMTAPVVEILDFSRNPLPVGKPEFKASGLSPNGLWRGRWLYGDNRSVPIWARVRLPGTILPKPVPEREIGRGDKVRVEVKSGGVLLGFDAEAESSGHIGERVTVRNPVNGQRFRAIVEAPGKVGIRK